VRLCEGRRAVPRAHGNQVEASRVYFPAGRNRHDRSALVRAAGTLYSNERHSASVAYLRGTFHSVRSRRIAVESAKTIIARLFIESIDYADCRLAKTAGRCDRHYEKNRHAVTSITRLEPICVYFVASRPHIRQQLVGITSRTSSCIRRPRAQSKEIRFPSEMCATFPIVQKSLTNLANFVFGN